jgi:hypothetical protein
MIVIWLRAGGTKRSRGGDNGPSSSAQHNHLGAADEDDDLKRRYFSKQLLTSNLSAARTCQHAQEALKCLHMLSKGVGDHLQLLNRPNTPRSW